VPVIAHETRDVISLIFFKDRWNIAGYLKERGAVMKLIHVFFIIALAAAPASCDRTPAMQYEKDPASVELLGVIPDYPAVRFVVFSDTHYHDASLGSSGAAYANYLKDDSKLLHLSGEILDAGMEKIAAEAPEFIIIPGDLTKDGERINHERFSDKLGKLAKRVPRIYVVPGNHDINNGMACRYVGDATEPVESISPEEFAKIYADYGFSNSLARDESSLSYAVEPVAGLMVLALDSCKYRENRPGKHTETSGSFSEATMKWIEAMLIRSRKDKKAVIAFMHHGIVEHYPHNEKYYARFIVDRYERVSDLFAAYGVRLVFTGHYHSQDITMKKLESQNRFVFDIETGSFVTHPCPYRVISIDRHQSARVESRFITSIASKPGGFEKYSYDYTYNGTLGMVGKTLDKYMVSASDTRSLAPDIARAYLAHLRGDEKLPEKPTATDGLGLLGRLTMVFMGTLIEGWNTDLPPADNNISMNLKTGEWR